MVPLCGKLVSLYVTPICSTIEEYPSCPASLLPKQTICETQPFTERSIPHQKETNSLMSCFLMFSLLCGGPLLGPSAAYLFTTLRKTYTSGCQATFFPKQHTF